MAEIGCYYIPMATYPVAKLKKMKVLVEVCPPHDAMKKLMEITVKKLDAQAVQITVSIARLSSKSKALSKAIACYSYLQYIYLCICLSIEYIIIYLLSIIFYLSIYLSIYLSVYIQLVDVYL